MRTLLVSAFSASLLVAVLSSACSSAGKTACVDGTTCGSGKVQSCAVSDSSGACASGYYKTPDGKTFNWVSCNDTNAAASAVSAYCAGSGSDSGPGSDSAPPGNDATPPDNDAGDDAAPE